MHEIEPNTDRQTHNITIIIWFFLNFIYCRFKTTYSTKKRKKTIRYTSINHYCRRRRGYWVNIIRFEFTDILYNTRVYEAASDYAAFGVGRPDANLSKPTHCTGAIGHFRNDRDIWRTCNVNYVKTTVKKN